MLVRITLSRPLLYRMFQEMRFLPKRASVCAIPLCRAEKPLVQDSIVLTIPDKWRWRDIARFGKTF
ncbi:hypothetical protein C6T66_16295 [Burkholderia multivorans]|uniref:Uncharacterized protein n=1 Tax=Burkholderia multivorans TaxID=87883 RepID=A0A8E2UVG2_9BURK|nr:hypothetical protein C6P76_01935 [Burkholderia multivorans]PRF28448.1 hypothetical protein C6P98_01585 [Burkholderia multivorans]PRG85967.1 hypothetical protein C6T66_16295 [Burkholderia multivorans]